ncbi:MAG TPA: hypothetical protein VFN68_09670 [Acidimicrobiales bacterium]|nr:hypothetical protein [Acidimicrobiales bacterium]
MYVRLTNLSDVTNLEAGLAHLADTAVAELAAMHGYRGLSVSGDRSGGRVGVLAMWDSLADLEASDSAVSKVRQATAAAFGGTAKVEIFEEVSSEVGASPPEPGCVVLIRRAHIGPDKLDEAIAFNRDVVIPLGRSQPGFRATRAMVDRRTGDAVVGIVFTDRASMDAARRAIEGPVLDQLAERGIGISEPEIRELLFVHLP